MRSSPTSNATRTSPASDPMDRMEQIRLDLALARDNRLTDEELAAVLDATLDVWPVAH